MMAHSALQTDQRVLTLLSACPVCDPEFHWYPIHFAIFLIETDPFLKDDSYTVAHLT